MGYTKTSDHPHSSQLTPTHPHPAKTYLHLPPPTHKKCPPTSTQPKYISTHPYSSQPTHKKCPRNPTHPKYTSTHPHLLPPNHKKCPHTPTHPKYTSTHPHPPRPTHIKCPPTPTYLKYTFTQLHPPIKCTHPKYTILINVLKCSRTAFNTTVPLVPTIKEKSPFRTYSVINSYFNSRSLWSLEKV